jgi:hypothetical protein
MTKMDSDQAFPDYKPVVCETDNFNKENYINLTVVNSNEVVPKQKDALGSRTVNIGIDGAAPGHVYDMSSLRLGLTLKLYNPAHAEGQAVTGHTVAPINYFAQTIIKKVEIFFNDVCVYNSHNYYAQRALFDAWLNHNNADREGTLRCQGFIPDEAAHVEDATLASVGFRSRAHFFGQPTPVEPNAQDNHHVDFSATPRTFYVPLVTDLSTLDMHLISQVNVRVAIEFHDSSYVLWTAGAASGMNYELQIVSCNLRVKMLQMSEGYERSVESMLGKGPLKYRHKRIEPKPFTMPANQSTFSTSSITQTTTNPERIMVIMQPERLLRAAYGENPMNWNSKFRAEGWEPDNDETSVLQSVQISVNGYPLVRQTPENANSLARLHHQEMTEKTGATHFGNGFPFYYFERGNYVQIYDITKAGNVGLAGNVRQPTKQGTLSMDMVFSDEVYEAIHILVFQEYNASFTINKNRAVVTQYLD